MHHINLIWDIILLQIDFNPYLAKIMNSTGVQDVETLSEFGGQACLNSCPHPPNSARTNETINILEHCYS